MKVTLFSNFLNAHQLPVSLAFQEMSDVSFTFVSLLDCDGVVGRDSLDREYSFVLREYEGKAAASEAMRHAMEDDIVVFGDMAGKEQYVKARAKTGKIFYRYAERLLKRGDWWRFVPPKIYRTWDRFGRYKAANMYVLCASAYTGRDLAMFGFPVDKCLKWGYFPDVEIYGGSKKKNPGHISICSAQRLISLKRVDSQIRFASMLKNKGLAFKLRIAGDGPERPKLENLSQELDVSDSVEFLGELTHERTIQLMRDSEIFLATSNRKEGWGATINEAMASGCCVLASCEMGSAPYLIDHEVNGFLIERCGGGVVNQAALLMSDEDAIEEIERCAKETIRTVWNAECATRMLIHFSLSGMPADSGPVSAA